MNRKKREKLVQMACPQCKTAYGPKPLILLKKDGTMERTSELPKKCFRCGINLQRFVTKVPEGMKIASEILPDKNGSAKRDLLHDETSSVRDEGPNVSA
jgi:hypothetical protein